MQFKVRSVYIDLQIQNPKKIKTKKYKRVYGGKMNSQFYLFRLVLLSIMWLYSSSLFIDNTNKMKRLPA